MNMESWAGPWGQAIIMPNEASRNALPVELRHVCVVLGKSTPGDGGGGTYLYHSGAWVALPTQAYGSGSAVSGQVLTADGSSGASFETPTISPAVSVLSFSLANGAAWTPGQAGIYTWACTDTTKMRLDIRSGGSWRTGNTTYAWGSFATDGLNVRIYNTDLTAHTIYYARMTF